VERLHDLQRVQAEYANYRRRTDREKTEAYDATKAEVLRSLLPVLDDLDRAQKHGDLIEDTPVAVIANKLRTAVERLGLTAYGEAGEAFDPQRYEAIAQLPNPEVTSDTIADVVERGYTIGERVVRVAKAAVFVPAS
jgi:molecular chaperone GrpE